MSGARGVGNTDARYHSFALGGGAAAAYVRMVRGRRRQTVTSGITPALVAVLGALATMNPLAANMFLPGLGALVADLDTTIAGGQLVYAGFLTGLAGGQLLVGALSDAFGRRPVLLSGLVLLGVSAAVAVVAPSIEVLVATRVVQGLGSAGVVVVTRAMVADRASGREAARAYSILMGIIAAGPFAAPLIGTAALTVGGWRASFLVLAVLAAAFLVLAWAVAPETLPRERRSAARIGPLAVNYLRLVRDRAFVGNALAVATGFAALSVHSAASSFVAQDILGTGPWGFAVLSAAYAGALLGGSMLNALVAGRIGPSRAGALAQGVALAATTLLLVFAVWGPFTLWSYVGVLLITAAAISSILANFNALTLARAGFAAASGAAFMGALQYGVAAVASPVGGLLGPTTAAPMAGGMLLCVLASVVCAVVGRGGFRLPPDARTDDAPIPRPARAPQGKHPRNTP